MNDLAMSRRAVTRAIATLPAIAAVPGMAATGAPSDPVWSKLVADYHAKYAAWFETIDLEAEAEERFFAACTSLPPEPVEPETPNNGNMLDKTFREIRDACRTPEHNAAWAEYEKDRGEWKAKKDALREQHVGPAKAANDRTYAIYAEALNKLTEHRVTNLRDLGEKIEIVVKDYDSFNIPPEYLTEVLADVRNLAGEAAHG